MTTARASHTPKRQIYRNRREAGRVLAGLLGAYRGREGVIVLGLARGGVPVAWEVAAALGAVGKSAICANRIRIKKDMGIFSWAKNAVP